MHTTTPPAGLCFVRLALWILVASMLAAAPAGCANTAHVERAIDAAVVPLMEREQIPGMAVGVVHGDAVTFRSFGVIARGSAEPVTEHTIFEIGSISKTFTALLGAEAVVKGKMALADPVSTHVPELVGTPLGSVTMAQLATYTPGGLPLQVPDEVTEASLTDYLRTWTPQFPAGTKRQYSNPSIGFFGRAAARASGAEFGEIMTASILPSLGLRDTYLSVPPEAMPRYATGSRDDRHDLRVTPGVLDAEAYGIKTTASDLCLYLAAQMSGDADAPLARAITLTHEGQYAVGPMTQALGWESYAYPTPLSDLFTGNSPEVIFEPTATGPLPAASSLTPHRLYNKTGSTGGFSAYVVFVPAKQVGVVLLANRAISISDRLSVAHAILRALDPDLAAASTVKTTSPN